MYCHFLLGYMLGCLILFHTIISVYLVLMKDAMKWFHELVCKHTWGEFIIQNPFNVRMKVAIVRMAQKQRFVNICRKPLYHPLVNWSNVIPNKDDEYKYSNSTYKQAMFIGTYWVRFFRRMLKDRNSSRAWKVIGNDKAALVFSHQL